MHSAQPLTTTFNGENTFIKHGFQVDCKVRTGKLNCKPWENRRNELHAPNEAKLERQKPGWTPGKRGGGKGKREKDLNDKQKYRDFFLPLFS